MNRSVTKKIPSPRDPFPWLATRMILLSATPVCLLALTVGGLLLTAYGTDAQAPFGALVHSIVKQTTTTRDALLQAQNAFPSATVFYLENNRVAQTSGESADNALAHKAEQFARSLTNQTISASSGQKPHYVIHAAVPPLPNSSAMVGVVLDAKLPSAIVVAMPLNALFPQMKFAWGMAITVTCAMIFLLFFNSLVFSGFVQQHFTAEELRRRKLERRMIEANRIFALGTLASGIAHEINNPLSIMTQEAGWIEDLTQDDMPREEFTAKVRASAHTIRTQGARCRDITHNLLRLSRQGSIEAAAVDLNTVVEEVATLSRHRCAQNNVTLDIDTLPDLPTAFASQSHVQQILLNLVNNALDAMSERHHGILTLRTLKKDAHVCITVEDNGPGMNESVLNRIFEPFFTTKPPDKGTGMGLAICYGLAKYNNGSLTVNSIDGEGSTFILCLPCTPPNKDTVQNENLHHKNIQNEFEKQIEDEHEHTHRTNDCITG